MLGRKTAAQGTVGVTVQASSKNLMKQPNYRAACRVAQTPLSRSPSLSTPHACTCAHRQNTVCLLRDLKSQAHDDPSQ